jgi:hypothetical protein
MKARSAFTKHAACRAQQRRIDPLYDELLERFVEEEYDGHGFVRRYFSKRSIRAMERSFGREPVRRLAHKLNVYRVELSSNGRVVTTGYLTKHMRRR